MNWCLPNYVKKSYVNRYLYNVNKNANKHKILNFNTTFDIKVVTGWPAP